MFQNMSIFWKIWIITKKVISLLKHLFAMAAAEPELEPMESGDVQEVYTPGENAIDISPNQDKGVLKEIIKAGEGTETPQTGNKVFVHYTGRLLNGTKFDSSRDRDDMFEFSLGKGEVIKAWDIGVATMKKGEICMLTCASDYAYGKSGSPPKIPADATLVFEVELIKWSLEDLSTDGDGGIQRCIITAGEGSDMPNEDAVVEVHLTGKYDGKVFEDRDVSFVIGEGSDHDVVCGLEIALKRFKKGETSKIILAPQYAFGSKGNPDFNIPPESEVEYEVTLKSFEKAKESWNMNTAEKLEQAEIVKNKGTKFFKEGKYQKAVNQYKKIVSLLQYETSLEGEDLTKRDGLLLAGYLNIAACYLKLQDSQNVIENSNKALEIESNNAKGLFRRGQARLAMNEFELAQEDFQHVVEVDPSNTAAQKQVIVCKQKIRQQVEKERRLYKNMFEKLAKYSETNGESITPEETKSEPGDAEEKNEKVDEKQVEVNNEAEATMA